jgi:hypothetical protein
MTKLRNIDALKKLLDGTHRTQTRKSFLVNSARGVDRADEFKVGECWHERDSNGRWVTYFKLENGVESGLGYWDSYEQYQNGNKSSLDDTFQWIDFKFRNCDPNNPTCERGFDKKSPKIERLIAMTGMCFDCLTKYELKLQMEGKFEEYAKNKIFENVKSYIRDQEIELEKWKHEVRNGFTLLVNSEGDVEKFQANDPELLISKIESEWNEFKEFVYSQFNDEVDESES